MTAKAGTKPTVVLLHGLARTHRSMAWLGARLDEAGYPTWAETYPSRRRPLADLADFVASRIEKDLDGKPLVAVTHSLGGVLVRHMAARVPFRAVVMLAPPNRGSRVARAVSRLPLYQMMYGPVGNEVTAPEAWPLPPRPCGVIAGTRRRSPGNPTSWLTSTLRLLPRDEPSDGTLLVDETRLENGALDDFTTVDASHTWILRHPEVPGLITRFIERGRFR